MAYFDNAATSTPYQEIVDTYVKLVSLLIGNPSSKNLKGLEASNYIEKARNQIKRNLLLPNDYEIIFTSGATESITSLFKVLLNITRIKEDIL